MAVYTVIYPPAHTADYVRATTQTAGNEAWRGTDPALPLTGTYAGNCWLSQQNIGAPQKFCISYGQSFRPGRLVLNNYHYNGLYPENGIKDFRVFCTNSAAAATNTDPANTTDLTLLAALTARQHIASNVADPQIFDFSASTDFQHIVLIIDSNFGGTYIAFRHIDLYAVSATIESRSALYASFAYQAAVRVNLSVVFGAEGPRAALNCRFGTAKVVRSCLHAFFRTMLAPRQCLHVSTDQLVAPRAVLLASFAETIAARSGLHALLDAEQMVQARAALHVQSGLLAGARRRLLVSFARQTASLEARAALYAVFDGPGVVEVRADLHVRWTAIEAMDAMPQALRYARTEVYIAGVRAPAPTRLRIVEDVNQLVDAATLDYRGSAILQLARRHARVTLLFWGNTYHFLVDRHQRLRRDGGYDVSLSLASPGVLLEARWAKPVQEELSGLASTLAMRIAAGVPLHWRMIDWLVQPLRWQATGQAPIDLLRDLASAAGGMLTSDRNGDLLALPQLPLPPEEWFSAAALAVTTKDDILELDDSEEDADPYNAYTVSDELQPSERLWLEEDKDRRRGACFEALVYQVPFSGSIDLSHRGLLDKVVLGFMGIEERDVVDEMVEIQNGEGRTAYPVYGIKAQRWNKINLGTIKYAEDGRLETAEPGETLVFLTYRTKAMRYYGQDLEVRPDPLLLVATSERGE